MSVQVIAVWKHETDRRLWLRLSRVFAELHHAHF